MLLCSPNGYLHAEACRELAVLVEHVVAGVLQPPISCSNQCISCKQLALQNGCADDGVQSTLSWSRAVRKGTVIATTYQFFSRLSVCSGCIVLCPCCHISLYFSSGRRKLCGSSCFYNTMYRCCLRPNCQTSAVLLSPPKESIWSADLWCKAELDTSDLHQQYVPTIPCPQLLH